MEKIVIVNGILSLAVGAIVIAVVIGGITGIGYVLNTILGTRNNSYDDFWTGLACTIILTLVGTLCFIVGWTALSALGLFG